MAIRYAKIAGLLRIQILTIIKTRQTILECKNCGHKFPSTEIDFTNLDISNKYFRINWNCPKCNTQGLTTFINNKNEDMR